MDAGDTNKYVTFAQSAVLQLLDAYRMSPAVFRDDFGIPESGNGLPDLLDELKWELDFLRRMQDASGTHGLFLKVGVDSYTDISPPSADARPRGQQVVDGPIDVGNRRPDRIAHLGQRIRIAGGRLLERENHVADGFEPHQISPSFASSSASSTEPSSSNPPCARSGGASLGSR